METKPKSTTQGFSKTQGFELLEHLPYGVMVADKKSSSFVYSNKHIQSLLGYSADELMGKTPEFIHPAQELDRVMMSFQAMLTGEMQLVNNIRFLTKHGAIVVCDIRAQLLESDGHTFICGFFIEADLNNKPLKRSDEEHVLKQRLNAAQEVGKMGFWTLFHASGKLEWSDHTFRIFGFQPQSFQPSLSQLLTIVYPDDRHLVETNFAKHLQERVPYDLIHRIIDAKAEVKYLRERCKTSFDPLGNPIYSFGTVVDVTELEQARLDAINNLEQLQQILSNSRSFYWESDPKGHILSLSESAAALLGYSNKQLDGQFISDFVALNELADPALYDDFLNGRLEYVEDAYLPFRDAENQVVWFVIRAQRRMDAQGNFVGYSGSASEVTERKLAEEQLQESEARFRSIAETLPGAVWISDLNFKMSYVSKGITTLTGYSQETFLSQPRQERYVSVDLEKVETYIQLQRDALKSGEWKNGAEIRLEVQIKCADGTFKWVQITTTVLQDHLQQPSGYLGVVTDISSLIEREEMLTRLNKVLEEGGRMAQMGTWELELSSNRLQWGKVTREIHEVDDSFEPSLNNALQFYLPEDRDRLSALVLGIQSNGGIYDIELKIRTAKGHERWVRTMGQAEFKGETCVRLWGVILNIDEYKQKTIALEQERARLKNVIGATKVATWFWNVQTGETIFDDRWAEMGGYTLKELEPISIKTWEMLCHPEDLALATERLEAYFAGNSDTYETEFRLKHKEGHWVWVRDVGSVVEWTADGKPLAMYGTHEDITQSLELNQQLKEKDQRLRLITENLNEVFWLRDAENKKLLYLSPSAESMYGIPVEVLIERPEKWLELVHPEDLPEVKKVLRAQKPGGSWELLYRVKRPNGQIAWIQSSSRAVYDEKGILVGHAGFSSDVSVRENLLHALEKAEQKYRIIAENNSNWEFWQLPTGQFAYHSPSSELITGYKAEELLDFSDKLIELIHPDDRKAYREHHTDVGCKRTDGRIGFRIVNRNGGIRHIEHICQPVFDHKGIYMGVRGTNIDVTEKKEAEQQLRKLWKAVEQSKASIVVTNLNGDIEYVNPYFSELTGYSAEDAIGKNPRILSTGHTKKSGYKQMFDKLGKGETWQGEFLNRKRNGDLYWESATISPIKNEQGVVESYLAIKEDITERKLLNETLEASEQKYRLIAEHTSDVIWVFNFNKQQFTYVSPSVFQLRGFTVDEALSHTIESTMGEEARRKYQEGLVARIEEYKQGIINEIQPMVVEITQPHKAGHWVWVEVNMKFYKNNAGEVEAIGVSRDIQERKKAEVLREKMQKELEENEARFKTLFYDNASAMYLIDASNGCFSDANEAALSFYGYQLKDFVGKPTWQINGDKQYFKRKLAFLEEHGQGRFEFTHFRADGTQVDVELFSSLLMVNGVATIHEIVHDISDRNKYLKEIERQNAVLKEIAWTQSHVMRAPVARIMGLVALLEEEQTSIQKEKSILNSLIGSARELDEMIHQVNHQTKELESDKHG